MNKNYFKLLLVASFFFSSLNASTLIDAKNPETILNIASGFGSAILEKDLQGDPKIMGRIDGIRYGIYFFRCQDNQNCLDIQFSTGWSGYDVSLDEINSWNQRKRFGKAYLDGDNDPMIEMDISTYAGVTYSNLEDYFDTWQIILREFTKEVLNQ